MTAEPTIWGGLIPSLCTPFDENGEVDLEELAGLARMAVRAGADGVACAALAAEVGELGAQERERCVASVLEEVAGRLPVLVGVGASSSEEAARLALGAQRGGADAIMLPLPAAERMSAREREDALVEVADTVTLPVMVQDAPAYLGLEIGPEVVARAAERAPNIRHLKIEGGSRAIELAHDLIGDRLVLWGGDGGRHLLDCIRAGAAGVIPGVEVIDLLVAVLQAELSGEQQVADARFQRVLPWLVFAMESLPGYVACAKAALVYQGLISRPAARMSGAILRPRATALAARHIEALAANRRVEAH